MSASSQSDDVEKTRSQTEAKGKEKGRSQESAVQSKAKRPPVATALISSKSMARELDLVNEQMREAAKLQKFEGKLVLGTASGVATTVLAGYVMWAFRGVSLLSSALAAMPIWRCLDPLPVLSNWRKDDNDEDIEADQEEDERRARDILEPNHVSGGKKGRARRMT